MELQELKESLEDTSSPSSGDESRTRGESAVELLKRVPATMEEVFELRKAVFEHPKAWERLDHFVREVLSEDEPDYALKHAVGLAVLGLYEAAEEELKGMEKLPVAACLLGRIYLETGREKQAAKLFEKIHKRVPEVLWYHLFYTEALEAAGDTDGFLREVERLEHSHPEHPWVRYFQGWVLEKEGDYEAAEARYREVLETDPNHAPTLFRLAFRADLEGRDEEAMELYQRCLEESPSNVAALVNLGILYDDAEEYEKALACFKLANRIYPQDDRIRWYLEDAKASLVMYYDEEKEKKEDKQAQILRIPVTDFELSVRSRNCLSKMNIKTLGDLIKKTEAELLAFKNFGETSLQEIKSILSSKGLRLGMITPDSDEIPSFLDEVETEVEEDTFLNKPLEELDLSVRSRNCLAFLQIKTLGQLAETAEQQLLSCKNFGQTSLNEIRRKLAEFGLSLKS